MTCVDALLPLVKAHENGTVIPSPMYTHSEVTKATHNASNVRLLENDLKGIVLLRRVTVREHLRANMKRRVIQSVAEHTVDRWLNCEAREMLGPIRGPKLKSEIGDHRLSVLAFMAGSLGFEQCAAQVPKKRRRRSTHFPDQLEYK